MKKSIIIVLTVFSFSLGYTQTIIESGTQVNGIWTLVNSPYLINGEATIPSGSTLVIEPGVEIRFKTGNDVSYSGDNKADVGWLCIKGKLVAEGTSNQRIIFTRQGDEGNWGCIAFLPDADRSSSFKYCKIQYANQIGGIQSGNYEGAVSFRNFKISISNSEIKSNKSSGIFCDRHESFSIYNCIVAENGGDGFRFWWQNSLKDTVKLINNTLIGNKSKGLFAHNTLCQVINCIFWANTESFSISNNYTFLSYSLIREDVLPYNNGWLKAGEGIIYTFNPRLNSDYSLPYFSRCVNAGIPNASGLSLPMSDIAGNSRIKLGRIDMGAFESPADKFIHITEPVGNEGFLPGTKKNIKWKSNAVNVKIEYTSNGGATWNDVVASTPNDGLYTWTIPSVESESCNIRISDAADNSFFDVCDNNFIVFISNIPDRTTISGRLTKDHSPYNFNGLVIVPAGDTLIIDPGVEIRFRTGNDYSFTSDDSVDVGLLYVKGNLIAKGTPNQRIIFTRQGGSGNWGCIAFPTSAGTSSSLKYCKVEFANYIRGLESKDYNGALSFMNPKIIISHSEITANNWYGIYSSRTTLAIHNCIIANNKVYGIYVNYAFNYSDRILIANNTIVGNESTGLHITAGCQIVNNIFWNNHSSLTTSSSYTSFVSYNLVQEENITGLATNTGDGMIYNYSPQLGSDLRPRHNSPVINAGTPDTSGLHLSIYDFSGKNRINLNRIDMGATESDAPEYIWLSSPNGKEGFSPGTKQNIKWKSNADKIKIEYTSNAGITWSNIVSTANNGLYIWTVPPVESESFNIRISDETASSVSDMCDENFFVFTSNIPDSTNLAGRLTKDHSPYVINGKVTVPAGDTLIIDPGVEIRFKTADQVSQTGRLDIKGTLIAEGNSDQKIIFTRQGDSGYWGYISFASTAGNSSCLIYCKIEFAGYGNGAVYINNPKVTVSHSEIVSNKSIGIHCEKSTTIIQNCLIAYNQKHGIKTDYAALLVKNCVIAGNQQDGISIWGPFNSKDTIIIANNTIVGNGSTGLFNDYGKCKIVNNIFWNNKESVSNKSFSSTSNILSYNLVQENDILASTVKTGAGMIYNLDPQFVNGDNDDYHLKATSPCIDAGDPGYNFSLEPFDNGGRINIGAYGNTPEAAKTGYLPRINFLSAREGRMFGKDTLTIKGAHFLSGRGSGTVKFGNTESSEYLSWSKDSIVCVTPPHLPKTVDINILNNNAGKGLAKNCFSFLPPLLKKPDPVFSKTSGGQPLILTGELFGHTRKGMRILFGQAEAISYQTWNDTLIKLTCPAHSEGLVDLTFRLNDSISYHFRESFLYSDKPLTGLCGELSDTLHNSQNYILTCPVTIPENQTLIIEPGVLIIAQYDEDTLISITANGVIKAVGNKSDTVKIISFPQYKGTWQGIILKKEGSFDHCVIKNGINGILVEKGNLELKNSTIANNLISGLDLEGLSRSLKVTAENTDIFNNNFGVYSRATFSNGSGNVSATFSSCNILDNHEYGIDLYSYGSIGGFIVPISDRATINITLKNSVVSKNGSNAVKMRSYGFESSRYSPNAHRYGYANLISENSIISDNGFGITTQRENITHCFINVKIYNSVMYNNNSVIEMDADNVLVYNTNLWDNGVSGNPTGICENLVFESCNLNDLSVVQNGSNNISIDPLYLSPETGDFSLQPGSPCIDAGSNDFVDFDTDFFIKARILDGNNDDVAIVDIGAFEYGTPTFFTSFKNKDFSYSVFPNPGTGIFNLKIESNPPKKLGIKLINYLGQVIETWNIDFPVFNQIEQFNLSYLSKGIYFLIISSDKYQCSEKIVIQ